MITRPHPKAVPGAREPGRFGEDGHWVRGQVWTGTDDGDWGEGIASFADPKGKTPVYLSRRALELRAMARFGIRIGEWARLPKDQRTEYMAADSLFVDLEVRERIMLAGS